MNILGINAYHGDASACIVVDGKLVFAVEEERLRRIKHWAGFPSLAIAACLEYAGLTPREIDHVAVGRDPTANLVSKLAYSIRTRPPLSLLRDRVSNQRRVRGVRQVLGDSLGVEPAALSARFHSVEHHLAHLASSYFLSPFAEAVCVSIDGFGDFASTMWGVGRGTKLVPRGRVLFPHSLGAFYTAGTQYLGFPRFGDEYKVMGLAPYGSPRYAEVLRNWIRTGPRGGFQLALDAFRHPREIVDTRWDGCEPESAPYYSAQWTQALDTPRRPDQPITDAHRDVARSLQEVFEEIYFHILEHASTLHPTTDLTLAGGCAFNSVANGKIADRTAFRRSYVNPTAGDAGTAVGAAYWVWHEKLGGGRADPLEHAFLGPQFSAPAIRQALNEAGVRFEWFVDDEERIQRTVSRLISGQVIGWFHGRSEWGPRALGNRSILADPRRAETRNTLNAKIKRRESFRPFAPAILEERAGEFFDVHQPSPFMNQVCPVLASRRECLPAVTHVDGSARIQTVSRTSNPLFHRLIEAFAEKTGVPVLLNTSFNENEPIVYTPAEAIDCFVRTRMDALVIGPALVRRDTPS